MIQPTLRPLLAPLLLVPLACGGDDGPVAATQDVTVAFAASVAGAPVSCDTMYTGLGATNASARLADARLYVSNVELRNAAGEWVPLTLTVDRWQREGVALLDFENGNGACADSGTADLNTTLRGTAPVDAYDGVRYSVGVPFELNHNDSATSGAPLDVPGMFWNWRGGYKFVRVDWAVEGGMIPRWNVHIGSTGCVSDSPATAPDEACGRSNAAQIELVDFDVAQGQVNIDLAALVGTTDLASNVADSPPGCMSAPTEGTDCAPVFSALGLGFEDGACVDGCGAQAVFTFE